jgi:hypothetical protein
MKHKHDSKDKKPHQTTEQPTRKSPPSTVENKPRRRSDNEAKIEDDMILRR